MLGRGDVFLNTVGDVDLLPKVLDAANRFEKRPGQEEMEGLGSKEQNVIPVWNRHVAGPCAKRSRFSRLRIRPRCCYQIEK